MEATKNLFEMSPLCGKCVQSQIRIGYYCLTNEHYMYLGCNASISGCNVLNDHFDRDTEEYKQNCKADNHMSKDTWTVRKPDAIETCRGCHWVEECGCNFDNCIMDAAARQMEMANERMKILYPETQDEDFETEGY